MNTVQFVKQKRKELEEDAINKFDINSNDQNIQNFDCLSPKEQELVLLYNCRLVFKVATSFSLGNALSLEEFIDAGIYGLVKAIRYFDASKNVKFSSFAVPVIKNEMLSCLRKNKKLRDNVELDALVAIYHEENRAPLLDVLSFVTSDIKLDDGVLEKLEMEERWNQVLQVIETLDSDSKQILYHYYGICGYHKLDQCQLAEKLQISQSWVSRKKREALQIIRRKIQSTNNDEG